MTLLYKRTGALLVEDPGAETIGLGFGSARELRVAFAVRKHRQVDNPPILDLKIYNLAEQTRKKLDQARSSTDANQRKRLHFEAGYAGEHSACFIGDAVEIFSARSGTEWITTITGVSGRDLARKGINRSFEKNSRAVDILVQMLRDYVQGTRVNADRAIADVQLGRIVPPSLRYAKGFAETGDPALIMKRLAETYGFEIWVDDQELVIVKRGEVRRRDAVRLWESTGMVGSPERITDDRRPNALICRAVSLLNPRIAMGSQVDIDSSTVRGSFRVEEIEHRGDTAGKAWETVIEAVAL